MKSKTSAGPIAAVLSVSVACVMAFGAAAQQNGQVENRTVDIWSDGTRMTGDVWKPTDLEEGEEIPALVLCHGWGGVREHLNRSYAPKFAAAGYVVLTFDYRGWGDSDSRMVVVGDQPEPNEEGRATVEVQLIRQLVDPFDQLEDIQAALDFIEGEPGVDRERIGIWGTSMGGGLVVHTTIHDDRIACVVSQVGAMSGKSSAKEFTADQGGLEMLHEREIKRARGEIDPVPQGEFEFPGLRGTPYLEKFVDYNPVAEAEQIDEPILLIDAENEELFDIREHSQKVYNAVKDKDIPSKYHVEPDITHYGIYTERYEKGADMALDWFDKHLK